MITTNKHSVSEEIASIFNKQKLNQKKIAETSVKERCQKLQHLLETLLDHRKELQEALYKDLGKHPTEVDITELLAIKDQIKQTQSQLKNWVKPKTVASPITQLGSTSYIHYEPKGVVLIISPWNFPISLTFSPLISAISAGNTAILKPSELTPHTSSVMQKIIQKNFKEEEVALIQGGVSTTTSLLKKPFNHIFFTGSPSVGKIVMKAAADHLCSVTLELGGKSPTIVDETADIKKAAARIAWGKTLNAGQICIAPDYLYVHESKQEELLERIKQEFSSLYGKNPQKSSSYPRIISEKHFLRINKLIEDALEQGATLYSGGEKDQSERYIAPTLLTEVSSDATIMQEEIFGPVLPVFSYKNIEEPLTIIQQKEKPLALYLYSTNKKTIEKVINDTRAGGSSINHNLMHYLNHNLPFGGVNHSGIGKGHGKFGFEAFSNSRGIYKQKLPWAATDLFKAPYTNLKQKIVRFMLTKM